LIRESCAAVDALSVRCRLAFGVVFFGKFAGVAALYTSSYAILDPETIQGALTGIPAEIIENVFYPLISGRAEGTGLGLSIAQNIVKNHEGLIECESQDGRTSFIISLPFNTEGSNK
jgi:nitrogen-specific signal transduction histidine kinase